MLDLRADDKIPQTFLTLSRVKVASLWGSLGLPDLALTPFEFFPISLLRLSANTLLRFQLVVHSTQSLEDFDAINPISRRYSPCRPAGSLRV
jgi:hypothetical protein